MTRQREHWSTRLGLILAAAGSAIGLGSLWKFPYVTGENGGGAFVIIYICATMLVCFPLFIAELVIGRAAQRGPVTAFANLSGHSPSWKGVGWLAMLSTLIVYSYYAVVSGWTLNYTFLSLSNFTEGRTPQQIAEVFDVMATAPDINLLWTALFIALTATVVYSGVREGIERWSRILMPALFLILLVLFVYAMTLPGFGRAFDFVFSPNFSELSPSGVMAALGLSFFTASLGFGIILTYGSYMRSSDDIPQTSFIVLLMTVLVSIVAALTIFPIIFSYGFEPAEGPGLVFKTLPVLFAKMPGSLVISTIFFILLVFTALTSTVSLLENLVANCMELFDWSRHKSVVIASVTTFVVGVPSALAGSGLLFGSWEEMYGMNFFSTMSSLWDRWFLPITGLLISLFVGWVVDRNLRDSEFVKGTRWRFFLLPWIFLVRWFVPAAIFIFVLQASGIIDIDGWFN